MPSAEQRYRRALHDLDQIEESALHPHPWLDWHPLWGAVDAAGGSAEADTLEDWKKMLAERWRAARTSEERDDVATLAEQWVASAEDMLAGGGEDRAPVRSRPAPPPPASAPSGPTSSGWHFPSWHLPHLPHLPDWHLPDWNLWEVAAIGLAAVTVVALLDRRSSKERRR